MYSSSQTSTQTNESRLVRVLCVLGFLLISFLGISELGTQVTTERRRLWNNKGMEWDDARNNYIGDQNGYTWASSKTKENFGMACCLPLLHVGMVAYGAGQLIKKLFKTKKITYRFKLGKLMKQNNQKVILAKLTNEKKQFEYAYLKRIEIYTTDITSDNGKLYKVKFVLNSLRRGLTKRMCDRYVFYLDEKEFQSLQRGDKKLHRMAELLRNIICHPDINLTLDATGTILRNAEEAKKNKKFIQIHFKTSCTQTRQFVLCTGTKSTHKDMKFYRYGEEEHATRDQKKETTFTKIRRDINKLNNEESVETISHRHKEELAAARKREKAKPLTNIFGKQVVLQI